MGSATHHTLRAVGAVLALSGVGLVSGCGDGTGPASAVKVTLQKSSTAQAAVLGWAASAYGVGGAIDVSAVDALTVTVTNVQVLPKSAEGSEDVDAKWVQLDVTGNGQIDLMQLPTESQAAVELAAGSVPAGDYIKVRLFVSDAAIVLNKSVTVGPASFAAGTSYEVTVPSGTQTGIKTDAQVTIPEGGGTVQLVFDPAASLANVTATGNGKVTIAPVIRKRGA